MPSVPVHPHTQENNVEIISIHKQRLEEPTHSIFYDQSCDYFSYGSKRKASFHIAVELLAPSAEYTPSTTSSRVQIFRALSVPQILMYTATPSPEVEKMAKSMGDGTVIISTSMSNKPTKALKQVVIWVESKNKKQKLFDILTSKQHFMPPLVVYVGSRLGADLLSNAITVTTGINALSIHGHKSMKERREAMRSFIMGEVQVMVATGILGRGMDLLCVRQVIIFDMPNSIKEYVHQIGRASRLGEEGKAIVFVNEENKNLFQDLVETLKSSGAPIPRELLNSHHTANSSYRAKNQKKRKYS